MYTPSGTNTIIGNNETFLDRNAKLIPSDETTTALTNAKWIAGHHEVATLADLYNIYPFILSPSFYAGQTDTDVTPGDDAVGQLWYVRKEKRYYQLIDWNNRTNASGWSETNITSAGNTVTSGGANPNGISGDCIRDLSINGNGSITYTAWDLNMTNNPTSNGVELKYTKSDNKNVKTLTTIPNVSSTTGTSGVISSTQYKALLDRLTLLENNVIWKSALTGNTTSYLWAGTLTAFNALGNNKPTNTTFIVTN